MTQDNTALALDALAQLRAQVRSHDGKPAPRRVAPAPVSGEAEPQVLFQQSLRGVQALKAPNRAELTPPKPVPQPRPRVPEAKPETAPASATLNWWQAAYQDVTPLKGSGRVDMACYRLQPSVLLPEPEVPPRPANTFEQAVKGVTPLPDSGRLHLAPVPPPAVPRQKERNDREVLRESLEGPISFEDRLDMGDEPAFLRPGIPRRVLSDLRRGRWVVQGELDLHGLTREEARLALSHFLAASLRDGKRCLRLIHGKGLGSPGGEPVLKHLSRNWLAQREEILAFCQARPFDGGAGALLILLRAGRVRVGGPSPCKQTGQP